VALNDDHTTGDGGSGSPISGADELARVVAWARAGMEGRPAEDRGAEAASIDWARAWTLAAGHRVTPLVYIALQPAISSMPVEIGAQVRAQIDQVRAHNLRIASEVKRLAALLDAAGIPTIPYKGVTLAERAYGSVFAREVRDIDLVVPPEKIDAARDALIGAGYRWLESFLTPRMERTYRAQMTHYIFHHDETGMHVELHWTLMYAPTLKGGALRDLWARTTRGTFWGAPVTLLAADDELWALLLHGSKHGWSDAIWACDVVAWMKRFGADVHWDAIYARADAMGARRFVALGVLMVSAIMGERFADAARIPAENDPAAQRIAAAYRRAWGMTTDDDGLTLAEFRRQWALRAWWGDRARYVGTQLAVWTPSPRDLAFVRLPRALYGLYPLVRAIRFGTGYVGRKGKFSASDAAGQGKQ
jgi:hypothetical protein